MRLGMGLRLSDRLKFAATPSSLLTGLVSYWTLNETSGTRADSVTASGNDLTDNNTVGYDTGKNGNAASVVAANDEVLSIVDGSDLELIENDYTVAVWYKSSATNATICSSWSHGVDFNWQLALNGSSQPLMCDKNAGYPGARATWSSATDDSAWHLAIGWVDVAGQKVYISVDGGAAVNAARTTAPTAVAVPFGIGADCLDTGAAGGQKLTGLVDEVAIWSRVLTANERAALYNSGAGITYPFLGT